MGRFSNTESSKDRLAHPEYNPLDMAGATINHSILTGKYDSTLFAKASQAKVITLVQPFTGVYQQAYWAVLGQWIDSW
jgi:hypothetical protein